MAKWSVYGKNERTGEAENVLVAANSEEEAASRGRERDIVVISVQPFGSGNPLSDLAAAASGSRNSPPAVARKLIACPACGREVSRSARSCPSCGQPIAEAAGSKLKKNARRVAYAMIICIVATAAIEICNEPSKFERSQIVSVAIGALLVPLCLFVVTFLKW